MVKCCKYIKKNHFVISKIYIKTSSMWKKNHKAFILTGYHRSHVIVPREYSFFFFAFQNILMFSPSNWWCERGTGPDMSSGLGEGGVAFSAHAIRGDNIGPAATNTPAQTESTKAQQRTCSLIFNSIKNNLQYFCLLTSVLLRGPNIVPWGAPGVYYHGGEGVATETNRKQH